MGKKLSGSDTTFEILSEYLKRIDRKLDIIIKQNEKILSSQRNPLQHNKNIFSSILEGDLKVGLDASMLFSLPTSLRKTIFALHRLGEATAEDIAKETGRMRAIESASANYLVRLGFVKKKRKRRKVYFYVE